MVQHIVMWKFKEDVDKEQAAAQMKEKLEALVGVVPGLQWLEVCPTYQGDADYALYSEFDSAEALEAYQVHPGHVAAKEIVQKYITTRIVADYEY